MKLFKLIKIAKIIIKLIIENLFEIYKIKFNIFLYGEWFLIFKLKIWLILEICENHEAL